MQDLTHKHAQNGPFRNGLMVKTTIYFTLITQIRQYYFPNSERLRRLASNFFGEESV